MEAGEQGERELFPVVESLFPCDWLEPLRHGPRFTAIRPKWVLSPTTIHWLTVAPLLKISNTFN
uniref:Uncharacterized protein n=1 Tax=Anguilla anguilla TaxID=7936 RepID=A0A0E9Q094_ANGAN